MISAEGSLCAKYTRACFPICGFIMWWNMERVKIDARRTSLSYGASCGQFVSILRKAICSGINAFTGWQRNPFKFWRADQVGGLTALLVLPCRSIAMPLWCGLSAVRRLFPPESVDVVLCRCPCHSKAFSHPLATAVWVSSGVLCGPM